MKITLKVRLEMRLCFKHLEIKHPATHTHTQTHTHTHTHTHIYIHIRQYYQQGTTFHLCLRGNLCFWSFWRNWETVGTFPFQNLFFIRVSIIKLQLHSFETAGEKKRFTSMPWRVRLLIFYIFLSTNPMNKCLIDFPHKKTSINPKPDYSSVP